MSPMSLEETPGMAATTADVAGRSSPARLLIVSHVHHYEHGGQLGAYGPYAREIDIWADLFDTVVIAAPLRARPFPGDVVAFTRGNIRMAPQWDAGGDTWQAKVGLLPAVPLWVVGLARAMRHADAIHVRCPGNLGLIGAALAPLFSRNLVAKYAGQWNVHEAERLPTLLQRRLLTSRWWKGPVTVYGEWPDQPDHIIPFFTSMMRAEQVARASAVAATKRIGSPLRVLYSGMLEPRKRVDALIDALVTLDHEGLPLEVNIVGNGPERARLQARAADLVARGVVTFRGALPYDESLRWFEWAHAMVLPSQHSEGWPKVVAEGMCHGLLCVAVAHGQVTRMLDGRGVLLSEGTASQIADALRAAAHDPERHLPLMRAAAAWAGQYSLEGLRTALGSLLAERWQVPALAARAARVKTGRPVDTTR